MASVVALAGWMGSCVGFGGGKNVTCCDRAKYSGSGRVSAMSPPCRPSPSRVSTEAALLLSSDWARRRLA
jgi:hypothetical protein